jgi:hypothetical protein
LVRPLGASGADRGAAHAVGLLPLAEVDQRLDEVDGEGDVHAMLLPVPAARAIPAAAATWTDSRGRPSMVRTSVRRM